MGSPKPVRPRRRRPEKKTPSGSPTPSIFPRPWGCGVLVVEDDPDLQWGLARFLTVRGNRVVGTSSGEGAIALISEWPVDFVLVDDELPGMSGIELAIRVRQSHPTIPVILMTGNDCPELREAAAHAGAAACLTKPLTSDSLAGVLASLRLPCLSKRP